MENVESNKARILIIDDEVDLSLVICSILRKDGYEVETAGFAKEGLDKLQQGISSGERYGVVVQDLRLPDMDGIELLRKLLEIDPSVRVVIITAFSTLQTAFDAMRLGAFDYMTKPFDNVHFKKSIGRAVQTTRMSKSPYTDSSVTTSLIICQSEPMKSILQTVYKIASTESTVFIQGESGTGKELLAKAIHYNSSRVYNPFITINCSAIPETLFESELFGHVKGSFTGATQDKKGLIEVANYGTVFLDEIGELSHSCQVKLLRILENRVVIPVGASEQRPIDVRFISATNRNLQDEVGRDNFREDLFYRLNVIPISIPPLRERKEDIPLLIGYFVSKYTKRLNTPVKKVMDNAIEQLMKYPWPGNIRELDNTVQRLVFLSESDTITGTDVAKAIITTTFHSNLSQADNSILANIPSEGVQLEKIVDQMEKSYIESALRMTNRNLRDTASILGMTVRSLRYKIKKLKIGNY